MKNLKKMVLAIAVVAVPMCMSAQSADKNSDFRTYNYIQAQGGLHLPFTPGSRTDLMEPTFGANIGRWFTPSVGARVGFEGLKSNVYDGAQYNSFDFYAIGADLMLNFTNLLAKGNNHKVNLYAFGGFGIVHHDSHDVRFTTPAGTCTNHLLRTGLGVDWKVAKPVTISLEYRLSNTDDKFNGRLSNKDDWYSSLMLGLAYNFGYSKELYKKPQEIATAPMTLYDQMQAGVASRMNTWMKRMKGESKNDYLLRTSEEGIEAQRLEYRKAISTDMAGNRISTNANAFTYNNATETLGVSFTDMPSIRLGVPKSELGAFRNTNSLQFNNTVYDLNPGDKFEVLYTEVLNPANGKTYIYRNTREAGSVDGEGYMPLSVAVEDMMNSTRLQQIKTNAVQEAKDKNILSDNTIITVATDVLPNNKDYKVSYSYTVKEGFSATEDFAPGKYETDKSAASTALLKIVNESMSGDFAKYFKAGKSVDISYTGSADASPINGVIKYNGAYGDIKNQAVNVNGQPTTMTVTKAGGIKTNEQLSLVRAVSVKNFVHKNVKGLDNMKVNDIYNVSVSDSEGSQFRRVMVEFLFHDAF